MRSPRNTHSLTPRRPPHKRLHTPHLSISFLNDPATTELYTLSLHDALPIFTWSPVSSTSTVGKPRESKTSRATMFLIFTRSAFRSEEHTSELQSRSDLVCRLLLEKKKEKNGVMSS